MTSQEGYDDIVQLLLTKVAEVNLKAGEYGCAPQTASCGGHGNIVQLLLTKGADVNLEGGMYGCTLKAATLSRYTI